MDSPRYALKDVWMGLYETQEGMLLKRLRFAIRKWKEQNPSAPSADNHETVEHCVPLDHSTVVFPEDGLRADGDLFLPNETLETLANEDFPRYFLSIYHHGYVQLQWEDGSPRRDDSSFIMNGLAIPTVASETPMPTYYPRKPS